MKSAIFIVGTQNLPHNDFIRMSMIIKGFVLVWNDYVTPAASDFGVKTYE